MIFVTGFLYVGKRERDHLENLGIDVKILFDWILGKWGGKL